MPLGLKLQTYLTNILVRAIVRTRINNATETLSDGLMFSLVRDMLQKASNSMDTFPISEIKASRIRQLIKLLKVTARVPEVEPADALGSEAAPTAQGSLTSLCVSRKV